MSLVKDITKLLFVGLSIGFIFHTYLKFIIAYLNPEKYLVTFINRHGEADIELILLLGLIPFIILGSIYILKDNKEPIQIN